MKNFQPVILGWLSGVDTALAAANHSVWFALGAVSFGIAAISFAIRINSKG